jgi:hypothetical protein
MAHQIIVVISDDTYDALAAAAAESSQAVEQLAEETLMQRYQPAQSHASVSSYDDFLRKLYAAGGIVNLPDHTIDPEEERRLVELFSSILPGKPLSEIIIEDRGPR